MHGIQEQQIQLALNFTDGQQNLSLSTQNCKSHNFKSWYPVRPGQMGLVTDYKVSNTVDKMVEQEQMVLFIRQLFAILTRELENGNGAKLQKCLSLEEYSA